MVPGFVTYTSKDRPILLFERGRQDYSDGYDDYVDMVSQDNGRTWSDATPHLAQPDIHVVGAC